MGCRRDRCLGKPEASGRADKGFSGPATVSAPRPGPPTLYGISQALTFRDPGQFPSPSRSSLCNRTAIPQGSGELVLRRNNDQRTRGTSAHVSSWSRESYVIHKVWSSISPPTSSAAEEDPPPFISSTILNVPFTKQHLLLSLESVLAAESVNITIGS